MARETSSGSGGIFFLFSRDTVLFSYMITLFHVIRRLTQNIELVLEQKSDLVFFNLHIKAEMEFTDIL